MQFISPSNLCVFPTNSAALSPPCFPVRFVFLFSNCYLVLFDKEKGVVCVLACFLYSPETSASHFFCYNVASSRALIITLVHRDESFAALCVCVCFCFLGEFCTEARESPVPYWANYSTSTPSMSAHRHTLEHGEHLLPLSSETRQTVQKRQRAAGEERNVFHFVMVATKTTKFTYLVSMVEDVLPLSEIYSARCLCCALPQ